MASMIALTNDEWDLVTDLFDPRDRRNKPAQYDRRAMVEAMLFLARTGCQWRYLPARYPPWEAVWQQWRRWRENGVWARAMTRLVEMIRLDHGRTPIPTAAGLGRTPKWRVALLQFPSSTSGSPPRACRVPSRRSRQPGDGEPPVTLQPLKLLTPRRQKASPRSA